MSGRYNEAVKNLRTALAITKKTLATTDVAPYNSLTVYNLDDYMKEAFPRDNGRHDGISDLYRNPIYLPTMDDQDNFQYEVLLSVTILFNLALAHHLEGLERRQHHRGDRSLLTKAIALYETSFQMAQREDLNASFQTQMSDGPGPRSARAPCQSRRAKVG